MTIHYVINDAVLRQEIDRFEQIWENESPSFTTYTSGSTGKPKKITIQKKHALASAQATIQFFQLTDNNTAMLCLNIDTIGGRMMFLRSKIAKMSLYVSPPKANPLTHISQKIDFIALAPIQLHTILEENPQKLQNIAHILVGGGEIAPSNVAKLKQLGITVFQTFGMSETISHIALKKVGFISDPYYTTLDHTTVAEQNACLCIHAPQLGIYQMETNDRVQILNAKQFIWLGRADRMINSGGIKIQIEELETQLNSFFSEEFFVFPKKDDKFGELVAVVIQGKEKKQYKEKRFYAQLSNKYYVPKEIAFLDQFCYTKSAKIDRLQTIKHITNWFSVD